MSAFIVADSTINKIVTWIAYNNDASWIRNNFEYLGYNFSKYYSVEKLGKDLYHLNCVAVETRYNEEEKDINYNFSVCSANEFEVLKAMQCWQYQCTEGNEVPKNPLYVEIKKAINSLSNHIISQTPEYEKAPWG